MSRFTNREKEIMSMAVVIALDAMKEAIEDFLSVWDMDAIHEEMADGSEPVDV